MATTRSPSSSSSPRYSLPSYKTESSRPPSFESSNPHSIHGDDSDSIAPVQPKLRPAKRLRKPEASETKLPLKPIPEKPILEKEKPSTPPPPYEPPKRPRYPVCLWVCFAVVLILIIAIVPPVVVIVTKPHPGVAGNTTTSVIRTTLILESTTIISSTEIVLVTSTKDVTTSATSPSATPTPLYLGGFDAVHSEFTANTDELLFYTDQLGNIQQINGTWYYTNDGWGIAQGYDSSWSAATPAAIANNALPGSPVQAVLLAAGEVQVFYVNNQSIMQNLVGDIYSLAGIFEDGNSYSWKAGTIESLGLVVSQDAFIRVCVPDQFTYGDPTPDLFLYYRSAAGSIVKYSWSKAGSTGWQKLAQSELPEINASMNVECQFDSGIEALWTFDSNGTPKHWWRSFVNNTGWIPGISGANTAGPNSSILSITAGSSAPFGRSHIFFQDPEDRLVRYDVNGRGANSTLANVTTYPDAATPGTRLSTWANGHDCGQDVDVYFQRDNTSQLHYLVFMDNGYFANGEDLSDGEYYVVTTSVTDAVMDLVVTWGHLEKAPSGQHVTLKPAVIGVIVIFVAIVVILTIFCCVGCCS